MEIIVLSKADIPELVEIDKLAFSDYDVPAVTAEQLEKTFSTGFVLGVKQNERLVSDIQIECKNDSEWYCCGIATLPGLEGNGFASALVKEVVEKARVEEIKKITCTIQPTNEKSIRIFQKFGFKKKSFLIDYFGKGIHRFLFELNL